MAISIFNSTNSLATVDLPPVSSGVVTFDGIGAADLFAILLTDAGGDAWPGEFAPDALCAEMNPPSTDCPEFTELLPGAPTAEAVVSPPFGEQDDILGPLAVETTVEVSALVTPVAVPPVDASADAELAEETESLATVQHEDPNASDQLPGLFAAWVAPEPISFTTRSEVTASEETSATEPAPATEQLAQPMARSAAPAIAPERAEAIAEQEEAASEVAKSARQDRPLESSPDDAGRVSNGPVTIATPAARATQPQPVVSLTPAMERDATVRPSNRDESVPASQSQSAEPSQPVEPTRVTPAVARAGQPLPAELPLTMALPQAAAQVLAGATRLSGTRGPASAQAAEPAESTPPISFEPRTGDIVTASEPVSSPALSAIRSPTAAVDAGTTHVVAGTRLSSNVPGARKSTGRAASELPIPPQSAAVESEGAEASVSQGVSPDATPAAAPVPTAAVPFASDARVAGVAPPVTLPPGIPDPVQQLVQVAITRMQIVRQVGHTEFELQLTPPDLGTLRVALRQTRQGLSVRVAADDMRTQQLLETSRTEIVTALEKGAGAVELSLDTQSGKQGGPSEHAVEPQVAIKSGNRAPRQPPPTPTRLSFLA